MKNTFLSTHFHFFLPRSNLVIGSSRRMAFPINFLPETRPESAQLNQFVDEVKCCPR